MSQTSNLFFLFVFFTTSLFAQNTAEKALVQRYPFDHNFFNLETLQYSNAQKDVSESFKTKSKYAGRYKGLAAEQLVHQGVVFKVLADHSLLLKNLATQKTRTLPNKEEGLAIEGGCLLLEAINGIVCLKTLEAAKGYRVYKYDQRGKELFGVEITHSEFVQHNDFTYHLPYLDYLMHTTNHIVFASYVDRIPKTVVLNTLDGRLSKFDFSSVGVIRDARTDLDLHGFVQLKRLSSSINVTYINMDFEYKNPFFKRSTQLETLVLGTTLFLVAYNNRSPEARLFAIDLSTQTLQWEVDVTAFGKDATSAYSKTVWLAAYEGKIILEAYETKGKSLQILDSYNGKSLWKSF
ncbi:MAG: Unknown protein [uncultured Aureispira sp.]|uniref:Uncharacterized protein n=1 Tax=uncultured Aureispira sp. TaxID=1331704 RepID=A0A6S6TY07_9BACT|nr:MAG: Unknown protein [uncultured Aureispira sp.]